MCNTEQVLAIFTVHHACFPSRMHCVLIGLQVVRLGGALYPWAAAAPAIIGTLAFGGRWDSALSAGAGFPVAPPASAAVDEPGEL